MSPKAELLPEVMATQARFANVGAHLDPQYGGISTTLPRFCKAVAAVSRQQISLIGFCHPEEQPATMPGANIAVSRLPLARMRWSWDSQLRSQLRDLITATDGVHIHGLWQEHCTRSAAVAQAMNRPYIISAHGMLERWALQNKRWKKELYSSLIQRPILRRARALHALTQTEAEDYRRYGVDTPVFVIPNAVETPRQADPSLIRQLYPELKDKSLVLFLGRIHYKKGLELLCRAWAGICRRFDDVHLVLAGPDFEGTLPRIANLAGELGISSRMTFTGMLRGEQKWSAIAAAGLFVLPSYSEGFSIAVLEALGMAKPVIVTRQCNFPEIASRGCGWVIDPDASQLESSLAEALLTPRRTLGLMGNHGRQLVQERYSWDAVGRQMADAYDWVLGAPRPSSFEIL